MVNDRKETVVLFNMGGANSIKEVDTFLINMFNDYHILNIKNSFMRSIIAKKIVNKIKPNVIKHYEAIGGKSPINQYTEKLVNKLNKFDSSKDYKYVMNYSNPSAYNVLKELKHNNVREITLFRSYCEIIIRKYL